MYRKIFHLKKNVLCLIFIERWNKEYDFLDPSFVRRETPVNAATISAVTTGPKNKDNNIKHFLSTRYVSGLFEAL